MLDVSYEELIALALTLFVLLFIGIRRADLRALPGSSLLMASFYALFVGYVFTVAEGFIPWDGMNFIEHVGYALSIVLLAVWSRRHLVNSETGL